MNLFSFVGTVGIFGFLAAAEAAIASAIGAIGTAVTTVGGWIASAGTAIGGFIGKIGGTIATWAHKAIEGIKTIAGKVWDKIPEIVETSGKVIHSVSDALGVQSEEDPAMLAYKAEISDKKLEDFDGDTVAYIEHLKNKIKLDKEKQEKFEKLNPHQKAVYGVVGSSMETRAIEQKAGVIIPPEVYPEIYRLKESGAVELSGTAIVGIMETLKEKGITNMGDAIDYLKGKGEGNTVKTGDALEDALKKEGVSNAEDVIADWQTAVRKEVEDAE